MADGRWPTFISSYNIDFCHPPTAIEQLYIRLPADIATPNIAKNYHKVVFARFELISIIVPVFHRILDFKKGVEFPF